MAEWQIIAHIQNDYTDKFGVPRQSGLVEAVTSLVVFTEPYRNREALRGIEEYSYLWLLWQFSKAEREGWSPTVRPPRLGGNRRMGVFATRSPYRPNSVGLSSVKLLGVEEHPTLGTVLRVAGADLMNGTPILDIKPYLAYTDAHPEAVGGFADAFVNYGLLVVCDDELKERIPADKREALLAVLRQDPRPSYQHDPERVYAMDFGGLNVRFTVADNVLTVRDIT